MKTEIKIISVIVACVSLTALYVCDTLHQAQPLIIVLPKDSKPLTQLPAAMPTNMVTIANERAILWWTVFNRACADAPTSIAKEDADEAVHTVYDTKR